MRSPVDEYLRWLAIEKGRSIKTLEAYRSDLQILSSWCGEQSIALLDITEHDIEKFAVSLRVGGSAPATVGRRLSVIRGFFGFLADERMVARDPASGVSTGRRHRTLPHPIPEEVLVPFLDRIDGRNPVDLRDRALFEFLYGTGARVSEVTALRIGDIDFIDETVRLFGKGQKQRLVPLGSTVRTTLRDYLEHARPRLTGATSGDVVFLNHRGGPLTRQGVDLRIRMRGLEFGLERHHCHAHAFRHSCATHMLAHGADIRSVQELLGHASIATTQVYTAVSLGNLTAVYGASHPRATGMSS
jgi:integrase/recombinase XerD